MVKQILWFLAFPFLLYANPQHVSAQKEWEKEIVPILENYCFDCHADGAKKGDFSFEHFPTVASMIAKRDAWKRVRENLDYQLMPPSDKDQPTDAERKRLIKWIDDAIFFIDPKNPDPGRVTLRRLNRHEYANTIHDLTGEPANIDLLPADDSGYGFDNIADVLTLSPTHLETYYNAAQGVLDQVYKNNSAPKKNIDPDRLINPETGKQAVFSMNASGEVKYKTAAGKYKVTFYLFGNQAGKDPVQARISIGKKSRVVDVKNTNVKPFTLEGDTSGEHAHISVAFLNDFMDEKTKADRNLIVDLIEIEGPMIQHQLSANQRIFTQREKDISDEAYAKKILLKFLSRAFRRPATTAEITNYLTLANLNQKSDSSIETKLRPALEAALISPHFLFREMHAIHSLAKPNQIQPVPDLALAARMSYFLWSSSPDDSTLSLAASQRLNQNLLQESKRMIRDPRTSRLIERFFGQWLQFQDLNDISIDPDLFPSTTEKMRKLMIRETTEFCRDLWINNQPIDLLINADYTYLNEDLAKHYRVANVTEDHFRKVILADSQRRGILSHASILAITSNPNRTSPVKRGKWVLETLLDAAPPPPPPNVPSLPSTQNSETPSTLRAQLELHRSNAACASCHKLMDGIGFAFEAYDVDGKRRPGIIDTKGTLATGEIIDSPSSLANVITKMKRDDFHRAFASKLLTFALGRGLEYYDKPAVEFIVAQAAKDNHKLHAYLIATMQSFPFTHYKK